MGGPDREPERETPGPEPVDEEPGPGADAGEQGTTGGPQTAPTSPGGTTQSTSAQPPASAPRSAATQFEAHDEDWVSPTSPGQVSAPHSVAGPETASVVAGPSGWANPTVGRLTSPFGPRVHPVLGIGGLHAGQDIANSCGTAVYAAAAGRVVWAGGPLQGRTGNQIVIAHGDGVVTRYGHLLTGSFEVERGEEVKAGQRIARIGGDVELDPLGAGNSTGCHLHFEVNTHHGLVAVDPVAWFAARGIVLGVDAPGEVRGADGAAVEVALARTGAADSEEEEGPTFDELVAELDPAFGGPGVPLTRLFG
jgi:murein DD-endopeptidase MepM/ murein hydrolase activator NlpD